MNLDVYISSGLEPRRLSQISTQMSLTAHKGTVNATGTDTKLDL